MFLGSIISRIRSVTSVVAIIDEIYKAIKLLEDKDFILRQSQILGKALVW